MTVLFTITVHVQQLGTRQDFCHVNRHTPKSYKYFIFEEMTVTPKDNLSVI